MDLKNLYLNISCYFGRRDIIHWISPYSTQQAVNLPTVCVGLDWIIYSFSNKYTQKEHKELLLWLDTQAFCAGKISFSFFIPLGKGIGLGKIPLQLQIHYLNDQLITQMIFVKVTKTLIVQNMQACITILESLMTWENYEEQWKKKRADSVLDPYQVFQESQLFSE